MPQNFNELYSEPSVKGQTEIVSIIYDLEEMMKMFELKRLGVREHGGKGKCFNNILSTLGNFIRAAKINL